MGTSPPLSRRLLLQGAALTGAATALSGCATAATGRREPGADRDGTGSHPDVRLVLAAIGDERALLDTCLGCLAAVPNLGAALAPLVAEQRRHVAALRQAVTRPAPVSKDKPARFHGSGQDALSRVRTSLVDAQHARRTDALAAESGPLARLLASISASHAVAAGRNALRS